MGHKSEMHFTAIKGSKSGIYHSACLSGLTENGIISLLLHLNMKLRISCMKEEGEKIIRRFCAEVFACRREPKVLVTGRMLNFASCDWFLWHF